MEKRSGASIKSKHFEGKITESYIENKRKRQKVRNERKRTLFKKAKQLHLMTGSDVVVMFKDGKKISTYFSNEEVKQAITPTVHSFFNKVCTIPYNYLIIFF